MNPIDVELERIDSNLMEIKRLEKVLIERKRKLIELKEKGKVGYDDLREFLCFKSLAYCCGIEKKCPNRDFVLKMLGISHEEYKRMKEEFDEIISRNVQRK